MQKALEIVVFRISGKQFFFNVPSRWCEECDLTIATVRTVLTELNLAHDQRVKLVIKPWVEYMDIALARGGWHPPVLLLNGRIFSQGVVPNKAKLKAAIQAVLTQI